MGKNCNKTSPLSFQLTAEVFSHLIALYCITLSYLNRIFVMLPNHSLCFFDTWNKLFIKSTLFLISLDIWYPWNVIWRGLIWHAIFHYFSNDDFEVDFSDRLISTLFFQFINYIRFLFILFFPIFKHKQTEKCEQKINIALLI